MGSAALCGLLSIDGTSLLHVASQDRVLASPVALFSCFVPWKSNYCVH